MNTTSLRVKAAALGCAAATVLGLGLIAGPTATASAATDVDLSCNRVVGTVGSIPSLTFSKRTWPLTGGLHMDTYEGYFGRNNGVVDATTHLYNSYWGMGYTGQVLVVARNSCGELIGVTQPQSWGVDAKTWFWNANERWEHWNTGLPVDVASRTASVEVIHNRVTGDPFNRYRSLRDQACAVWDVYQPGTICPLPKL